LRVLQDAESNDFEGIATGDESWFRYCYPSLTKFAQPPFDVIPRTRQTIGAKKIMITIFFTARELILLDVLPKGSKFNQQYLIDYVFPDSKTENLNFRRRVPLSTFWVHMDDSMCHSASQWVKSRVKIRQASHCTITAPTLFARLEPVRLLALRDVERNPEGSRVLFA
jgi:hypothetical protein